jgi:hypothetical protein
MRTLPISRKSALPRLPNRSQGGSATSSQLPGVRRRIDYIF